MSKSEPFVDTSLEMAKWDNRVVVFTKPQGQATPDYFNHINGELAKAGQAGWQLVAFEPIERADPQILVFVAALAKNIEQ
jgi:hypothetical protein